ncbi:MAG: hypothetical protein AAF705_14100, partial [Bacteroidota bacterium]
MNPHKSFVSKYILILICLTNGSYSYGQKEIPPAFFAYAQSEKSRLKSIDAKDNKSFEFAKNTIQKVLDDLVAAQGDKRYQQPKLVMNNQERYVAWMNPKKVEIGLEAKAYAICQSFGKDSLDAVAALLAHELIHYYSKHNWTKHFTKENANLTTAQLLNQQQEGLKNETQADYLGGFLGYSAGYNTLGMMPKVLQKVYQTYNLPEQIRGYPSLLERQKIATLAMDKLTDLANVFNMATFLTVIGDYAAAKLYYQSILKDFQSRELHNNLGVA